MRVDDPRAFRAAGFARELIAARAIASSDEDFSILNRTLESVVSELLENPRDASAMLTALLASLANFSCHGMYGIARLRLDSDAPSAAVQAQAALEISTMFEVAEREQWTF